MGWSQSRKRPHVLQEAGHSGKVMESTETQQMPTGASDVGYRAARFCLPGSVLVMLLSDPSLAVHIPSWKGNICSVRLSKYVTENNIKYVMKYVTENFI